MTANNVQVRTIVVEDEPLVRLMTEDILTAIGCVIVGSASSLAVALTCIATTEIDLAVLDINLAGTDVYPAAELLRTKGTPIIFVTGVHVSEPSVLCPGTWSPSWLLLNCIAFLNGRCSRTLTSAYSLFTEEHGPITTSSRCRWLLMQKDDRRFTTCITSCHCLFRAADARMRSLDMSRQRDSTARKGVTDFSSTPVDDPKDGTEPPNLLCSREC